MDRGGPGPAFIMAVAEESQSSVHALAVSDVHESPSIFSSIDMIACRAREASFKARWAALGALNDALWARIVHSVVRPPNAHRAE